MRGRTGLRKAVAGGAAVGVFAVVGLLLLAPGGMPLIPGGPPTTSDPDPDGFPPGGPTPDLDTVSVLVSHLDIEADDLSARVGPEESTPAADLRGPVEISVHNPLAYVDAEVDSLDGLVELDRDGGEARSLLDRSTRGTEEAMVFLVVALIVLRASLDQDRDRRLRASAPASASASAA